MMGEHHDPRGQTGAGREAAAGNEVTAIDLSDGWQNLGLREGDTLCVHSSLRSFGHVAGGADTVVKSLLDAVGPTGTLVAPIFRHFFWQGDRQVWDRHESPSLMGRISETVRCWPGACHSRHAPHPLAAIGAAAQRLSDCDNRSDFGFDSPFQLLIELDAWILLVGVGWQVCTLFHLLEERAQVPYREWVELRGTVIDGESCELRTYPFLKRRQGVTNDFAPAGAYLAAEGVVHQVDIGASHVRAVRARDLYDLTLRFLRRDPLALVATQARLVATEWLPKFGQIVGETCQQPQEPLAPSDPLAARLACTLNVTRTGPPSVEVLQQSSLADGLQIQQWQIVSTVNGSIPAALALPAAGEGLLPAVICLHGTGGSWERLMDGGPFHARGSTLIGWGRELARRGFAVLAPTQLNQIPRREPWDWQGSKLYQPYGHTAMGRLVDDVVACVDVLQQHPRIDPARIAVVGFSLGGIVSFYSFAVDHRLAAAVSFCGGVGSVAAMVETGVTGFHSLYYYIPGLLAAGLDHPQLAPALAPRPLFIGAADGDPGMPVTGVETFAAAARQAYADAPADSFHLLMERGDHALTRHGFDAATSWLQAML